MLMKILAMSGSAGGKGGAYSLCALCIRGIPFLKQIREKEEFEYQHQQCDLDYYQSPELASYCH